MQFSFTFFIQNKKTKKNKKQHLLYLWKLDWFSLVVRTNGNANCYQVILLTHSLVAFFMSQVWRLFLSLAIHRKQIVEEIPFECVVDVGVECWDFGKIKSKFMGIFSSFSLFNKGIQSLKHLPIVLVMSCLWDGKNHMIRSLDDITSIILIVSISFSENFLNFKPYLDMESRKPVSNWMTKHSFCFYLFRC